MNSALELFANEGFHSTSISKIAKIAGISKGLIYNYFESKDDLLQQIIIHGTKTINEPFDRNKDGLLTEEEFKYFLIELFSMLQDRRPFWRLFYALLLQPNVFTHTIDTFEEITERMQVNLLDFFKRQNFEEPEKELLLFKATIEGASLMTVTAPGQLPLEPLLDAIIERYSKPNK